MLVFGVNKYFTIPGKIGSMLFDQQGTQLFVTLNKDDKRLKLDPNQASLISKVGLTKTLKDVAVNTASGEAITISNKDTDFARINLATYAVQTLALPVKADKEGKGVVVNYFPRQKKAQPTPMPQQHIAMQTAIRRTYQP